jgi:DNA (cytosine-5)-methyltransferase 1
LGLKVDKYYASEIDKHAIKQTMLNFPDTIQLGSVTDVDVSKLDKIDLLIGGSPCTNFSFAGKRNGMSTTTNEEIYTLERYLELKNNGFEFEGQSYLFWEYMRILRDSKPNYFLLENVEMGEKWETILSEAIGIRPVHINSALVSAQNRRRLYWVGQIRERLYYSENYCYSFVEGWKKYEGKSPSSLSKVQFDEIKQNDGRVYDIIPIGVQGLDSLFGEVYSDIPQPEDRGILLKDILEDNVNDKYYLSDKMVACLKGREKIAKGYKFVPTDGNKKAKTITKKEGNYSTSNFICNPSMSRIRRLTPTECSRLQTIPEWYRWGCSDTQAYRMLGNGWNIETIKHIFNFIEL